MDEKDVLPNFKENEAYAGNPMAKLEDALVLCKFGLFHWKLMFTTLLSVYATTAVTTTTSYILPSAECDLELTMMQKGLLNAIPFLGQICACMFTGFLTDAFGRKIFLAGGNVGIFVIAVIGASSQSYVMLLTAKLLEGIVMSIVFTATATFLTEFVHRDVRDRILVMYSSFMSVAIITAALVAWAILPQKLDFVLIDGYFEIHPWNIYLYVNALWSLFAALMYSQMPESPKFLLSHNQENKALDVLKYVYHKNTGNDGESFPITSLNITGIYKETIKVGIKKKVTNALFEVKELFRRPLIFRLILFSAVTFMCLLVYSALRLWFPQLSTMIENYQKENYGRQNQFCVMIDDYTSRNVMQSANVTELEICVPKLAGTETYTNGLILGFVSLLSIILSSSLVDFFGQKPLIFVFLLLCGVCAGALYWTNSSLQIAIMISATCGFMQAAFSLQHSILVRVFPTSVRTMALSLVIMVGRIGSLLGNILFPLMLNTGCMVPFLTLIVVTWSFALLVYFFPNPKKENGGTGDR
ncbi:synaptic vesicle glycoprotein 2B-like [Hyposmocoma kahamanoa]|uniref:synaptic vesicle glycoprotein 2B-like n=1 Tax=Hyposmocoma kahamanoa TaxID=1477025 RepID=UPI000E6D78D3|nr:synaptic vesicle glycoprotein 2B-like [Hyposmocoma kahamanoa]